MCFSAANENLRPFSYPFHRVFGKNHTRVVPSDDELLDPSSTHIAGGVRAAAALIQLVCHVLSLSLGVRESTVLLISFHVSRVNIF